MQNLDEFQKKKIAHYFRTFSYAFIVFSFEQFLYQLLCHFSCLHYRAILNWFHWIGWIQCFDWNLSIDELEILVLGTALSYFSTCINFNRVPEWTSEFFLFEFFFKSFFMCNFLCFFFVIWSHPLYHEPVSRC